MSRKNVEAFKCLNGRDENVRPNGRGQRRQSTPNVDQKNVSGRRRPVETLSGRRRRVEKCLDGRRRPVENRKAQYGRRRQVENVSGRRRPRKRQ